jgi:Domain of unknown function (DUF4337)
MPEVFEAPEGREDIPFAIPVTIALSILAVLLAVVTLLGHRAAKEELLLQNQESDQWAFFQAKNSGLHGMQTGADMLATLAPVDKEKADALREKYLKEAERYSDEKTAAKDKAEELKKERLVVARRGDRYEGGEVILEMALIICSFTLLTKKKIFWHSGMLIGLFGLCIAFSGFLLH